MGTIVEKAKKDKNQDEELSKLVNDLIQSNIEKENQISELKTICEDLSSKIEISSNHVDSVENQLIAKMNEKPRENYIIAIVTLIVAIVQMFGTVALIAAIVKMFIL